MTRRGWNAAQLGAYAPGRPRLEISPRRPDRRPGRRPVPGGAGHADTRTDHTRRAVGPARRHRSTAGAVGQKAVTKLTDELDILVGSGGIDAAGARLREADCGRRLRKAALDRLEERGVGLRGMLAARV